MFEFLGFGKRGGTRNTVRVAGDTRFRPGFEVLELRECPAMLYWAAGEKSDGLWSTLTNWLGDDKKTAVVVLPTSDDTLAFDGDMSVLDSTQDILGSVAGI